jgi:stress-induced-phosphoprotein 1
VLFALREYTKALEALDVAREQDEATGSKSAREIQELSFKIQSAMSSQRANETEQETMERAMRDPEVAVCYFSLSPCSGWADEMDRKKKGNHE